MKILETEEGMKRKGYDALALIPYVVAENTCGMEYEGREWSEMTRSRARNERIEKLRKAMTRKDIEDFAEAADNRCRFAHENRAEWFAKLARARGNSGRDRLYMWMSHWLAAFLSGHVRGCSQ